MTQQMTLKVSPADQNDSTRKAQILIGGGKKEMVLDPDDGLEIYLKAGLDMWVDTPDEGEGEVMAELIVEDAKKQTDLTR